MRIVSLQTLFFLSTAQKLGPLIILRSFTTSFLNVRALLLTIIIRLSSGIKRTSFNKILAASSLINLTWLIVSGIKGVSLLILFFRVYSFLLLSSIFFFRAGGAEGLTRGGAGDLWINFIFLFRFLSLGGIPPLLGFIRKVLVLKECSSQLSFTFLAVLTLSSVLILVFYLSYVFCRLSKVPPIHEKVRVGHFRIRLASVSIVALPLSLSLIL